MKIHIVQKGDSLEKIAERYEVDFEELKKLNSQLSNPDLIMPGMKIKVPSGGVPVKKEEQLNMRKELPKKQQEHPFAKEKPKSKLDVEDIKPKQKPSVPYVPPVPNIGQSSLPEGDISNLYQSVNQLHQPYVPPKPYEHQEKGSNMYNPWTNEEENHMENVNYPNVPQPPNVGAAGDENKQFHGMPNVAAAGYHHHPYPYPFYPGGCWIPVSPVLPGSGLCHPWHPYPAHMPYMHQPSYVSPAEYDGDDNMGHDNAGHHGYQQQPMTAPAYAPYQQFPGFAPPNVGHAGDPNMAHGKEDDCGCGPGHFPGGFPGAAPYGQMPQMGAPYGMGGYGQQQPAGGQMFNRPEDDED
ncbi:SafA/ExsA family spore coat assembly protein [Bacillus haynesii]|uniref:SafA/ExsA family spore coat assembly protein n=1 Tax=Bacillus haynesii TaxID=1925021 RepID=UPI0022804538|nr:SafA/ExsA family spore coat assembly protein [Bacillus haynesii]MCY7753432.1 SafA/ExsA family spore coat assembly protein [Bacillus haynesii]MCY7848752.1 SafA/ExsA family spore coat assembly protein [Bacillus haynesii]MCY7913766.1 SafA/ExsA family spore coat assembly protein [Bacillus haynesii]MCY7926236.1 SafA/ExsA family spore coat assembly protein [Bacillus haynesii]MCY7999760.1 SafA/ExsA family spore coat assembly protein [Bacillus haynesii]